MHSYEAQSLLGRCLSRTITGKKFLGRFYDILLTSSPLIKPKFSNTDFAKLKFLRFE